MSILFILLFSLCSCFYTKNTGIKLDLGIKVANNIATRTAYNSSLDILQLLLNKDKKVLSMKPSQFVKWATKEGGWKLPLETKRYLWDNADGMFDYWKRYECVEYELLCAKLKRIPSNLTLIYYPRTGGLGNKLYSVITTVLMSISVQYQYASI